MNASAKYQSEEKQEDIKIQLIASVSSDKYTSLFGKLLDDATDKIELKTMALALLMKCAHRNTGTEDFIFSITALSLSIEALIDENIKLRYSLDILAKEQLK